MDVAFLGRADSDRLLVLSSGLHGVEGFCGSGCQVALLRDPLVHERLNESGIAVALVHAVNPWGFSHLRRVNEDGIDLNRNFIEPGSQAMHNPSFDALQPLLVPHEWPRPASSEASLQRYIDEHGLKQFQQVLMGGQRSQPDSLFFAGTQPAWSNTVLRGVLQRLCAQRHHVAWIDLHTGLGPAGHGEKISVGVNSAAAIRWARETWGIDVVGLGAEGSASEAVHGHAAGALHRLFPDIRTHAMALEFGTVPLMQIVDAMRSDQWLVNHGASAAASVRQRIKQTLKDAFYIDSDEWRAMVVAQTRVAVLQAFRALAAS